MQRSRVLLVPLVLLCTHCTLLSDPQPVADLVEASTPPAATKPAPPVPARPLSQHGKFSAYVPPRVSPGGDMISGHEVELNEVEPADVVVRPAAPIPRA